VSGRFQSVRTPIGGLILLKRQQLGDARGHLSRLFDAEGMAGFGWHGGIAQVNETVTLHKGTVRGLHFQRPPFAEAKLVTCLRGGVLDVAVDIRRGSPTFLRHYAVELTQENMQSLLIPEGFAHGFQAMTNDVQLLYAHSAPYRADSEGGLNPRDPALNIAWSLPPIHLSARDQNHAMLDDHFEGIAV
jgi:dTDP-4-dehydrorhamnose 3,5-epimerase